MRYWLITLLLLIPVSVYGNGDTLVTSLDSYDQRLLELRTQKEDLNNSWEEFRSTHGGITDFIKNELSSTEKQNLSLIVENYLEQIRDHRDDLEIRKTFFSSIEGFIDWEKKWLFEKYRDTSVNIENERLELTRLIRDTETQKEARTDILRTHIADNALERRQNIRQRIEPILRERLDAYTLNGAFKKLPDERKALIFWRILGRIQMKQSELESSWIKTTVVLDRIETYTIIESIMLEYIRSWR